MTQAQFILLFATCWFGFGSTKLDYLKSKAETPPPIFARLMVIILWPLWTLFANKSEQ
jgi:hypothetical protein